MLIQSRYGLCMQGVNSNNVNAMRYAERAKGADSTELPKLDRVHALKGAALPRASHYGEITLLGTRCFCTPSDSCNIKTLNPPMAYAQVQFLPFPGIYVLFLNVCSGNNFSVASGFGMLLLMAVLFLVLTWYLDNVLPSEYGVPLHPTFPFSSGASLYCRIPDILPMLLGDALDVSLRCMF